MRKNFYQAQKVSKEISELWCKYFGCLKYCGQYIRIFEDESIIIRFDFNPELLVESIYDECINLIEEYLHLSKINYELTNDKTVLIIES